MADPITIPAGCFKLVRDTARYGDNERKRSQYPAAIYVEGTLEQARDIAVSLSFDEPGCTDYWVVEGDNG